MKKAAEPRSDASLRGRDGLVGERLCFASGCRWLPLAAVGR